MRFDWTGDGVVLAATPGIPLEWVYAALKLPEGPKRRALRAAAAAVDPALALENAYSVVDGDGLKMIEAVVPHYSGAVPIWSAVELNQLDMSDAAIGKMLGVHPQRVRRWRINAVFCPLTLVRLRANRGHSLL